MAFAQLTYRESLRDIQACLRAAKQKTYHMGIPPEDPIRYCKVAWCPFKKQKPWFAFVNQGFHAPELFDF